MKTYALSPLTAFEKKLLKDLSGSASDPAEWKVFPAGEFHVRVGRPPRRVAVIGRTQPPADNFLRTLLLVDTLSRNGAREITLVLPYFAYARQDRQSKLGDPLSAQALLAALKAVGARRIVTVDLHSRRVAAASPLPIRSLDVARLLAGELKKKLRRTVFSVVAPDRGAVARARSFARAIGGRPQVIWGDKVRGASGKVVSMRLSASPRGKTAVIVDDLLDTGGTVARAARLLRSLGVKDLYLCVTHPVFSGAAARLVGRLGFRRIIVADALEAVAARRLSNFRTVSVGRLLARAVK